MDAWQKRLMDQPIINPAVERMRPIRFSAKTVREMTDDEIMAILSGEDDYGGTLYPDTLHLLSYELNRRELQRATATHWTTVPGFWFTVVAALFGVIGVLVAVVIALLQSK